jgi:hypothetical protein
MDSWRRNAFVVATLIILCTGAPAAAESAAPAVTIRILDYAGIAKDVIANAQERVAAIYGVVGVQIRWQVTRCKLDSSSSSADTFTEPAEFVLIVLSSNMSRRLKVAPDVMGMAIVPAQGAGHIGYVLFDRVTRAAWASRSDVTDISGLVIAYEIGHLMLPDESHSDSGLMRAKWNFRELQRPLHPAFMFTIPQGEAIRRSLRRRAPGPWPTTPDHQPVTTETSVAASQ